MGFEQRPGGALATYLGCILIGLPTEFIEDKKMSSSSHVSCICKEMCFVS